MRTIRQLLLSVLLLVSGTGYAQLSQNLFEEFLLSGTEDANTLFGHYMLPGMKGLGYGVNSGWYNTAKPHETFGFDITLSYVNAIVPEADKTFEFLDSEYNFTFLGSGSSSTLPTLMGDSPDIPSVLDLSLDGNTVVSSYNAPDGVSADIDKITMIGGSVPTPIIQVGFGLVKGTELKIRWLPDINIGEGEFKFKYFGLGGMHSISQWLPVFKNIPVDISAFVGWTTISAEYAIPENFNVPGVNQRATADITTFTYQLIASAHVSVLTGYVALGYDNFKTNFKMLGTYDISNPAVQLVLEDPIDLDQEGNSGFRTAFGARLKLSIITLTADYTLREYNTLTLSLGFSVR